MFRLRNNGVASFATLLALALVGSATLAALSADGRAARDTSATENAECENDASGGDCLLSSRRVPCDSPGCDTDYRPKLVPCDTPACDD